MDRTQVGLDQKDITRLRILECIRAAGSVSRIDIAGTVQISPATVTSVTSDLLAAGLIVEVDGGNRPDNGRHGRPRVMLKLNGAAHRVAGLKVARHAISVLLSDFEGTELTSHEFPLNRVRMAPEEFVGCLRAAVDAACAKAGFSIRSLSGISIGIAGQVNAAENSVHWSSSIIGRNVDLGPILRRQLPCSAFVENDANLVAKAEQLFGLGRDLKDFLVVTIEHGVGLGIVLDGHLYRGVHGCGAEFGHMKVHLDGALYQCGQRGCLEAYVGDYALIREAEIANHGEGPKTVSGILEDAQAGDPSAQSVLERAGQMFGIELANLVNLFDPERIILSGARISFDHLHSDEVIARIRRSVVNVGAPLPEIRVHRWGDMMWAKGAAAYGIEQVSVLKVKEVTADAA